MAILSPAMMSYGFYCCLLDH